MEKSKSALAGQRTLDNFPLVPDEPQVNLISEDSAQSRLFIAQLERQCSFSVTLLPPGAVDFAGCILAPSLLVVDLLAWACPGEQAADGGKGLNIAVHDLPVVFLNAPAPLAAQSDHAILPVSASFSAICAAIAAELGQSPPCGSTQSDDTVLDALTAGERRVLELLKYGLTNQRLADELHKSTHTIKSHLYSIYQKLECRNRAEAALIAARAFP
ncbi:LuxR family transcriptional regulator [Spiribacter insolitus]|uniref:LuxR C-terminal-related transcriptional regulator n=1 Tax=Spiribacter insolitus TaxID=3122417 RepID=A0ABV3T470_9GAMM